MRAKKKTRSARWRTADAELSMTPMIDVVFQLLIYFLVTFSAAEALARLDVSRPAPDAAAKTRETPGDMIRVAVLKEGFAIEGRGVEKRELFELFERLAEVSVDQTVLVNCADESEHGRLVEVLDACAATGLKNIAVVSAK